MMRAHFDPQAAGDRWPADTLLVSVAYRLPMDKLHFGNDRTDLSMPI